VVATAGKVITVAASAIPAARTVLRSGPGLAGEGGGLWSRLGGVLSTLPHCQWLSLSSRRKHGGVVGLTQDSYCLISAMRN
jgi:hypothetical protein